MHFILCPACKVSMVIPEEYVNFRPWLDAHMKTCPGEMKPKVLARVRKKKEKKDGESPVVVSETKELDEALDRLTAAFLRQTIKKVMGK